jgi:hypothetical protein
MPQIGRCRIIQTLASNLYTDDPSDKDIVLSIRDHFVSPFSNHPSSVVPLGVEAATVAPSAASSENDSLKKAQNITVRFRDVEKKFSGKVGENYSEFLGEFTRASAESGLTIMQKLELMHHVLRDEAKYFYSREIEGKVTSFAEATAIMLREYNSPTRQLRFRNSLKSLRIGKFVKNGISPGKALEPIYCTITNLASQEPEGFRRDIHCIDYLRDSVLGAEWAKGPLSRIESEKMSCHDLFSALESAYQLESDCKSTRNGSPIPELVVQDSISCTNFIGQARYGNRPGVTRAAAAASSSNFPKLSMNCFNCGEDRHGVLHCRKQLDSTIITANKLMYFEKKDGGKSEINFIKEIIFEVCQSIDADEVESDEHSKDVFEQFTKVLIPCVMILRTTQQLPLLVTSFTL